MSNNATEMKEKFDSLYNQMASSNKVENMALFGHVLKQMMYNLIENKPEEAKEYIDKLCAMRWNNYLTDKEADAIVAKMDPAPLWSKNAVMNTLERLGIEKEEEPYYNSNALYVTISMEYSDSGRRIAKIMGIEKVDESNQVDLFRTIHGFAMDKLKDKDKVFNIRHYFNL